MAENAATGTATNQSGTTGTEGAKSSAVALADASKKVAPAGERGKTSIADQVVAKIAGIATREINGVYDVGGATERMVGKVREVIPGTGTSTTQGINLSLIHI